VGGGGGGGRFTNCTRQRVQLEFQLYSLQIIRSPPLPHYVTNAPPPCPPISQTYTITHTPASIRCYYTAAGVGPGTTHLHKITNAPVVYMECDVMSFMWANPLLGL